MRQKWKILIWVLSDNSLNSISFSFHFINSNCFNYLITNTWRGMKYVAEMLNYLEQSIYFLSQKLGRRLKYNQACLNFCIGHQNKHQNKYQELQKYQNHTHRSYHMVIYIVASFTLWVIMLVINQNISQHMHGCLCVPPGKAGDCDSHQSEIFSIFPCLFYSNKLQLISFFVEYNIVFSVRHRRGEHWTRRIQVWSESRISFASKVGLWEITSRNQ